MTHSEDPSSCRDDIGYRMAIYVIEQFDYF